MPGGLRARSIVYEFPFYEREGVEYDPKIREENVIKVFDRIAFVRSVWVEHDRLREPLFIEVNPQHHKLQDRSIAEIETGLEKMLEKIYQFKQCL